MGFLDSLIKDIASGELDKKLNRLADSVEALSGKVDGSVKKIADQPEKLADNVDKVKAEATKAMDVVRKKDNEQLAA